MFWICTWRRFRKTRTSLIRSFVHGVAAAIFCFIVMKGFPPSCAEGVIPTVVPQEMEMESELVARAAFDQPRLMTAADTVGVSKQLDAFRHGVRCLDQRPQQMIEERTVFVVGFQPSSLFWLGMGARSEQRFMFLPEGRAP